MKLFRLVLLAALLLANFIFINSAFAEKRSCTIAKGFNYECNTSTPSSHLITVGPNGNISINVRHYAGCTTSWNIFHKRSSTSVIRIKSGTGSAYKTFNVGKSKVVFLQVLSGGMNPDGSCYVNQVNDIWNQYN